MLLLTVGMTVAKGTGPCSLPRNEGTTLCDALASSHSMVLKGKAVCTLEDQRPEARPEGCRHFTMRETTRVQSIQLLQTKEPFCLHQLSPSCPFQAVALCVWSH